MQIKPCDCGSGLPSVMCCAGGDTLPDHLSGVPKELAARLEELIGNHKPAMLNLDALTGKVMNDYNSAPLEDFDGLSPEQMNAFLAKPFDSKHVVEFLCPETCLNSKAMRIFSILIEGLGEKGLKTTQAGNLPRAFVREAALEYWGPEKLSDWEQHGSIRREADVYDLETVRLLSQSLGFVRKYKGRFIVSSRLREIIKKDGLAGVYVHLIMAHTLNYNWGLFERDAPYTIFQDGFLFTLWLLHKYGNEWRSQMFYWEKFLKAFPFSIIPLPFGHAQNETPASRAADVFRFVSFRLFSMFFGFAEGREIKEPAESGFHTYRYEVRKLPLLDEAVHFKV